MIKFMHHLRKGLKKNTRLKKMYLGMLNTLPVHTAYNFNRLLRTPYSNIEDDNSFIFIHIPKAAGNAVIKNLYGENATGHDPLTRYEKHDFEKLNDYFKFTVVRNPYDRIVSAFFYLKQGGIGFFDQRFSNKYLDDIDDFNRFIDKLDNDLVFQRKIMSWIHFLPQVDFILDSNGEVGIDYIAHVENFEQDLKTIANKLDVDISRIESVNKSKRTHFEQYYSSEMKEVVARLYKNDFLILNYEV